MTSVDTAHAADEGRWYTWTTWLRPRWLAPTAVLAAGAAASVSLSGDVLVRPGWFAAFSAYNVLAFATAALLWLRLRPRSSVGLMLLGLAALVAIQSLQGSSSSLAFSIGVLADPFTVLLAWYALMSFPSSKLTRPAAAVFTIAPVGIFLGFAPWFFLSPHVSGGTPLARCTPACPTNALMIANRPDVAGHFGTLEEIFAVAFAVAFLALIAIRIDVASPPRRRVLASVYVVAAFWLTAFAGYQIAAYLVVTDLRVYSTLGWLLVAARIALPLAFVVALLVARVFAGRALSTMLQRVGRRPGAADLERAARDALGDPALRLGLWRPEASAWTDVRGELMDASAPADERSSRILRSDGLPVAELRYDASLDEDPELVDAASTAILLSLERSAVVAELRRSRRRIAAAGDAERRRLEQNLHDSAQQRLVALRIRMGLVQELVGGDHEAAGSELGRLGHEVDTVLDEIRAVAHGIYPPILREEGLAEALADAVRLHPRARLSRGNVGRYPEEVEAAVYFSTMEVLQNASKHSGPNADILVSLWEDGTELRFEVLDDGCGFDPAGVRASGGLAGVEERLKAFGGGLEIRSAPGRGSRIFGSVRL
jgi:signal transduction histidine kinase